MLAIHHISKSYNLNTILSDVSFTVKSGQRLGMVGPNGCGKTTLLRIIMGEEHPDGGSVQRTPASLRIGYLPQGYAFDFGITLGRFLEMMQGDLPGLSSRLEELAGAIALGVSTPAMQAEYDAVLESMTLASESEGHAPAVMAALGLAHLPPGQMCDTLSGGEKTRLALAGVLLSAPQLLLLDEPTNHLDLDMLEWLEGWLGSVNAAALLVSHDRAFLDHVATGIVEIDPFTHTARAYEGNYTDYLEQKVAERERQQQAFSDQREEVARLRGAAARVRSLANFRKGGKADSGDKFAKGFFGNRSLETSRRAKALEKRLDYLNGEGRIDKPPLIWQMRVEFGDTPASGREVLRLEDGAVGYGDKAVLTDLNLHLWAGSRTVLVGPNGSGKTTLLRTITGDLPLLRGNLRLGANLHPGWMTQEQRELDPALSPLESLAACRGGTETDLRAYLSLFLFKGDDVFIPAGSLSWGQRARLALACLAARGCNFLLLDEPLNHLDIPSRTQFELALERFEGTALVVTHDRYFIDSYARQVWQVVDGTVRVHELHP